MKQPRDDTNLLGKTGICALYEWCVKRHIQPSIAMLSPIHGSNVSVEAGEEFEMAVYLDGVECGRGRGQSKASAKQEAARKALQALVPGILFDTQSGVLVELPQSMAPPRALALANPSHASQRGNNNPGDRKSVV